MQGGALSGLRVLDLTHVLAGPYCSYQLGLLGADVIKIESPHGDMVRGWGGSEQQLSLGLGSGFAAQNAGKRSLCVDLNDPRGVQLVADLAAAADILVENFRPGSLAAKGLGYDRVKDRNPAIIYTSISAFGRTGPQGDRSGFDDVVQATSGFMSINQRGDGPIRTGGPVLDYATGMHATAAILAAVLQRQQTRQGQHVDIAMQDVTLLLINRNAHIAATTGTPPAPAGNRDGLLLGRYPCADGYVMLAGYLPRHQRAICRALALTELGELSGKEMAQRAEEVEQAVSTRLLEKTRLEWDKIFHAAGIVAGGVHELDEVLASEQQQTRQLFSTVDSAVGPMQVTNNGYLLNNTSRGPSSGVPQLGEHSVEILSELGLDESQIEQLLAERVIATPADRS
ncbi:MAG: CoA transferase [Pseudomonadota bacterium]